MRALKRWKLLTALGFLQELHVPCMVDEFHGRLAENLRKLIAPEALTCDEDSSVRRTSYGRTNRAGSSPLKIPRSLQRVLGPHVSIARSNARELTLLIEQTSVLTKVMEASDYAAIALAFDGRVRFMTPNAGIILEEFFGSGLTGDHRLPAQLARWARDREEARLAVRTVPGASGVLSLLRVHRASPGSTAVIGRSPLPNLTNREAEVLFWVAQGARRIRRLASFWGSALAPCRNILNIFLSSSASRIA
jgi:hypothetical protein